MEPKLTYDEGVKLLRAMETVNGKAFNTGQKVEILLALFYPNAGAVAEVTYREAVDRLAPALERIPDFETDQGADNFDTFDGSILLTRLYDLPRDTTLNDIVDLRRARLEERAAK